jgi:hypothetical protein
VGFTRPEGCGSDEKSLGSCSPSRSGVLFAFPRHDQAKGSPGPEGCGSDEKSLGSCSPSALGSVRPPAARPGERFTRARAWGIGNVVITVEHGTDLRGSCVRVRVRAACVLVCTARRA